MHHLKTNSLASFDTLPDSSMIGTTATCALMDCGRTTLWRRIVAKQCPPAIIFGKNCQRFNVGELRKYLASPLTYTQPA